MVALKVMDAGGALSLETGWVSHDLASPATPMIVNGVVFTLATGLPSTATGRGTAAVLHAYEGATGKRLWDERQGDDDIRVAGEHVERLGSDLRRHV